MWAQIYGRGEPSFFEGLLDQGKGMSVKSKVISESLHVTLREVRGEERGGGGGHFRQKAQAVRVNRSVRLKRSHDFEKSHAS